ncbi:MAG: MFS transporter [Nitrospinae bacterium]|nr:MFS transporter [Nitrospinota bacterium]
MKRKAQRKGLVRPDLKPSSWIYFLFFFSGISGLIYQVVWTRMLTLVFGHTIYSVSVVLSAFMAGLGLGSYLYGTTIDKVGKPLLVYGKVELLIGLSAAFLSLLFSKFSPVYAWFYQWMPDLFFQTGLVKAGLAFSLVLIPTIFMGATLPIMAKYFVTGETHAGKQVGYLYSINTFGAAAGCLVAGYFLIEYLGVLQTALVAASVNIFIGIFCVLKFKKSDPETPIQWNLPKPAPHSFQFEKENILWIAVSFLCGFSALAYEVVWTRILVFGIGSTVYSFSLMLANFLFGITVGGLLIVPFFKRNYNFRILLTLFQLGIGIYIVFSIYQSDWVLSSFFRPLRMESPLSEFWIDVRNASALMFFPTLLFGMSFPVLTHLVTRGSENIGSSLGLIYAVNTLGGILGSLVAGYLLLPNVGSQQTLTFLAMLNVLTGILLFATSTYFSGVLRKGIAVSISILLILVLGLMPDDLLQGIFLRNSLGKKKPESLVYLNEGLTTTVAVFNDDDDNFGLRRKSLILNGVNMSANHMHSQKYMTLLSYIPLLLIEDPKDVLVICFGTGLTSGAAGVYPGIDTVDAVDISPGVFIAAPHFSDTNYDAVKNPKIHQIVQDGRNHLLTTSKKYDVITAEPPPPTNAGAVNLYTREYYELTKKALKPGGIVSQWIPLHSQTETHIYEHFRTFLESFPYVMSWYPSKQELIIIGSNDPLDIDFKKIQKRFEHPAVKNVMGKIRFENPFTLLGSIWFLKRELEAMGSRQRLITDNNASLEFFLSAPNAVSKENVYRFLKNRASFSSAISMVKNLTKADEENLKIFWDQRLNAEYAGDMFELGVQFLNKNDLRRANEKLREAVKLDPSFVLAHYFLGNSLAAIRDFKQAENHFQSAIQLQPDFAEAHGALGNILAAQGNLDGAITKFEKAIEIKPNLFEAQINLGIAWEHKGESDKAHSHYKKAIRLQPQDDQAYLMLANSLYNNKKWKEAVNYYREVLKLNPELVQARENLKKAQQQAGNKNTSK